MSKRIFDIIVSLSNAQTCIHPLMPRRGEGSFCCAFSLLNRPRDNRYGERVGGREGGGGGGYGKGKVVCDLWLQFAMTYPCSCHVRYTIDRHVFRNLLFNVRFDICHCELYHLVSCHHFCIGFRLRLSLFH